MTLSTDIRIVQYIDPVLGFKKLREIVGTPPKTLIQISVYEKGTIIFRDPPGLEVDAWVSLRFNQNAEVIQEEVEDAPKAYLIFNLDTGYRHPRGADSVHNSIIKELAQWLLSLGVQDYWAENEFDGTWHHNQLPY